VTVRCGACKGDLALDAELERAMLADVESHECAVAATVARCACGRFSMVTASRVEDGIARIGASLISPGVCEEALLVMGLHRRFAAAASRN
jgi:hypothetical protein